MESEDDTEVNPVIQEARQRALAVLQPSDSELEHGLELHRSSIVCDCFGFLPGVWTPGLIAEMNELREGQIGARDWHWRTGRQPYRECSCHAAGGAGARRGWRRHHNTARPRPSPGENSH